MMKVRIKKRNVSLVEVKLDHEFLNHTILLSHFCPHLYKNKRSLSIILNSSVFSLLIMKRTGNGCVTSLLKIRRSCHITNGALHSRKLEIDQAIEKNNYKLIQSQFAGVVFI